MNRFLQLILVTCAVISCYAMAGTFSLDLEANNGRFSYWRSHDLGPNGIVRVNFEMVDLRPGDKWSPSASFALEGTDPNNVAGVRLLSGDETGHIEARIELWQGDQLKETIPLASNMLLGDAEMMNLHWESNGVLKVSIGNGITKKIQIPFAPASLKVSCSGSELIVHRLELLSASK